MDRTDDDWLHDPALDSDMARLIRSHDWTSSPLGPPRGWSPSLRNAVRLCLATRFPVLIVWGEQLAKIYNDGYREMLGTGKHPGALGSPAEQVWTEIWDVIGPMFAQVLATGRPTWVEHQRLVLHRSGFDEECFFTYSYSALFDDDGSIAGVLDIATETTDQVVPQRRLECLTELTGALLGASTVADVCLAAARVLTGSPADVRAADLHLQVDGRLELVASTHTRTPSGMPEPSLADARTGDEPIALGWRGPGMPAEYAIVPIPTAVGSIAAVAVVALNLQRPYDDAYVRFLRLIGDTIASALATADRRGALREINATLEQQVLDRTEQVRTLASRLTMAEQEERRRISQILHDDLQQVLYGVDTKLWSTLERLEPSIDEEAVADLRAARGWVDAAIDTTRQLTVELSPLILDKEGLVEALQWLQRQIEDLHQIRVLVVSEDDFWLDDDLRVLVFQIVRELLLNVRKHAGTDRATVSLRCEDDELLVNVTDEGHGFDPSDPESQIARGGLGLYSARERLQLVGGSLLVDTAPGAGTVVELRVPLQSGG